MLRPFPFILLLTLAQPCSSQTDSTSARLTGGGSQLFGQLIVGGYGEIAYPLSDRFLVSAIAGIGLNNFANDSPVEPPVVALPYTELEILARVFGRIHIVAGAGPALYYFDPVWFTNVNGWF